VYGGFANIAFLFKLNDIHKNYACVEENVEEIQGPLEDHNEAIIHAASACVAIN
jgi:hypothetical protein